MIIAGDKNQFSGSHGRSNERKHRDIQRYAELIQLPLPVADYILVNDKVQAVIDRVAKRGMQAKKMDFVGTYNFAVDAKKSLVEVAGCLCNSAQHARIEQDLTFAKNNGIHIIWLIENNEGVRSIQDLFSHGKTPVVDHGYRQDKYGNTVWRTVHKTKVASQTLAKTLYTMEHKTEKYDIEFLFCKPSEAGQRIVELLTEGR